MSSNFTSKNIKKFVCEKCDFKCSKKGDFNRHLLTGKHKNQQMSTNFTPKNAKKFSCKDCHFECSKRSDWSRHISTQKHKIRTNTNDFTPKNAEQYHCNCGKKYKHASSLWNHKNNCENKGNHDVQKT